MRKLLLSFLLIAVSIVSQAQLATNLVAWYKCDEVSGTTLDDAIGSNNLTASVQLTVGSTTSLSGRSLFFDSNSDYATLTTPLTYVSNASYSMWINATSVGAADMVLFGNSINYSRIFIGINNNLKVETDINGDEGGVYNTFSTGTWYHIVITRANNSWKFYRNGTLLGTVIIGGADNLTISSIGFVNGSFRGYIDEIGIWNKTLDPTEVTQLYNNGTPLVPPFNSVPTVTTQSVTNVVGTTAVGNGNITSTGGSAVTVSGVCWSTSTNPTISDSHTTDGGIVVGAYISDIGGLSTNSTYYVKAYATNAVGTSYGNEVSFSTGTTTITTDLVAHWQLNETSGNAADAVSGIVGTPYEVLQNVTPGYAGTCYDFDGLNDYLQIADNAYWTINTTDNISINLHIKLDGDRNPSGYGYMMLFGQDVGPSLSLKYAGSTTNYKMSWYCGGVSEALSSTLSWSFGQWYQVSIVKTGNSIIFYRDGSPIDTINSLTDVNTNPTAVYIGGDTHSPVPEVFNGKIDEVSFYRRALTGAEVSFLHTHSYPYTGSTLPPGTIDNMINGVHIANNINGHRIIHYIPQNIIIPTGNYIYPLKKSLTGTFLVDQNNKAFLWQGDAGWELFQNALTSEASTYLDNRQAKGFTSVLVNMIEHELSNTPPADRYGHVPFSGTAFQSSENENYWAHVDTIINMAATRNMMIFAFPVCLGAIGSNEGWVTEVNAASDAQMLAYGQFIGNRYKNYTNIVWCVGGDRDPITPTNVLSKMTSFVTGLKQYDSKLITVHGPQETYGLPTYQGLSWIDFDNVYTRSKTSYTWFTTTNPYNGRISHWSMDETYGNTLLDDVGGMTATKNTVLASASGKVGGAQYFNFATFDHATIYNSSIYNFSASSSFTVTYWMKFTDTQYGLGTGQDHIIISKGEWDGGGNLADGMWASGVNGSGKVNFLLRDNTGYKVDLEGSTHYDDGSWHLVCLVRDGSTNTSYLYCDGIVIDHLQHTYSGNFNTTLPIQFACLTQGGNPQYYYQGYLDEPTIYNRALSQAEIVSLQSAGGSSSGIPKIFIEGTYEGDITRPYTDAEQRHIMYSTYLSGGCGFIFGNVPLFAFGYNVYGLGTNWAAQMDKPQSMSMKYLAELLNKRSWELLVPDLTHQVVTGGYGTYGNTNYVNAALTSDNNTLIAYVPTSSSTLTVNLDKFTGDTVTCWWYNPSTEEIAQIGKYYSTGLKQFNSPSGDQVLLIDNTAANFPTPGIDITPPVTPPPASSEITILMSDNLETGSPAVTASALSNAYNFRDNGYVEASQSIINVGGVHGNVWKSIYHAGLHGNQDGCVGVFYLPQKYKELYIDYDMWFDPQWDGTSTKGFYSGKASWGIGGWKDALYVCLANGTGKWTVDSSANGNGIEAFKVWGSASGGFPNNIRAYWYDQKYNGEHNDLNKAGQYVNRNYWRWNSMRVVMNTMGKSDGIIEYYTDGVMTDQETDIEWFSVAQMMAGVDGFNAFDVRYFFGGGGDNYNSPRDNTIYMDNIVGYYPTLHSTIYPAGPSPIGHTIPRVAKDNAGLVNVYIPHVMYDEALTTPTGTIKSTYNYGFHSPSPRSSSDIKTVTITNHSNPIHFTVTQYDNGFNLGGGSQDSWIKIYQGTGGSKTPLYYWDESNLHGEIYVGYQFNVPSTSCTIEYYPGTDSNGGFTFTYN